MTSAHWFRTVRAEVNFARSLRLIREAQGLSQAEIASRATRLGASMQQQTVARIEAGRRSVRLDEACAIARTIKTELSKMIEDPVLQPVYDAEAELKAELTRLKELETELFQTQVRLEHAANARLELDERLHEAKMKYADVERRVEMLRTLAEEREKAARSAFDNAIDVRYGPDLSDEERYGE